MLNQRLKIEDYFTDATSAGITTQLDKPEVVNRLLNTLICNFQSFNFFKLRIELKPVKEELEEYKNMDQEYLSQSYKKLKAWYDGHQLALKRILNDISYDTHLNTKVYSPVVGCPIGCEYCFSKKVVDHFELCENFRKPVFRGFYKMHKDADGNDVPELFNIESENPIDWFLTYMSDYGCWKPEWQENVLGQIIAASNLKRRKGKHVDTFQLVTKCPKGIRLESVPEDTDMRNVIFSCTVDTNNTTGRITDLISRTKDHKVTASVVYQPVREYISPVHLDEFVNTFGKDNSWVIVGGEVGGKEPFKFEWVKDIIDKCVELGIPVKMEMDIRPAAIEAGYDFLEQEPKIMRDTRAIRKRNLAMKNANVSDYYDLKIAQYTRKLKKCAVNDNLDIAAFIMFGDIEITVESAKRLLAKAPDFDVILTAETKGIPLAYEMSRQSGKRYVVARKSVKLYMQNVAEVSVKSITTDNEQKLYLDEDDAALMNGKKVLIVDDVISTGESLKALEALTKTVGGITAGKVAVLAEGDAAKRDDIIFLEPLPVFPHD